MKDAMHRITNAIRARTKQEWEQYFADLFMRAREFVRSDGEKAAIIAFCLGIFLVMFYKLVIILVCVGLIAHQLILIISDTSKHV